MKMWKQKNHDLEMRLAVNENVSANGFESGNTGTLEGRRDTKEPVSNY